jgi:hypothetical protein
VRARGREGEGVWAGFGPTEEGEISFFLIPFISYFYFLNPVFFETKILIHFLGVQNEIFYVKCYKKSWCMHMMSRLLHEMRSLGDNKGVRSLGFLTLGSKIGMLQPASSVTVAAPRRDMAGPRSRAQDSTQTRQ